MKKEDTSTTQQAINEAMECLRKNSVVLNEQKLFDDDLLVIQAAVHMCSVLLGVKGCVVIENCRVKEIVFLKNGKIIEKIENL